MGGCLCRCVSVCLCLHQCIMHGCLRGCVQVWRHVRLCVYLSAGDRGGEQGRGDRVRNAERGCQTKVICQRHNARARETAIGRWKERVT